MGEHTQIYMQDKPETAWITIGEHCCQSNSSRIMQKHILFILIIWDVIIVL